MSDLWIVLNIVLLRYIFLLQTVALLLKVVFDSNNSDLALNSHFTKSLVFFVGNILKVDETVYHDNIQARIVWVSPALKFYRKTLHRDLCDKKMEKI